MPTTKIEVFELKGVKQNASSAPFIGVENYKVAEAREKPTRGEQVTKDWLRNADYIFLNGVSLRDIITSIKLKELEDELKVFLSNDQATSSERAAAVKKMILVVLKTNNHEITENQIDLEDLTANPWFKTFMSDMAKDNYSFATQIKDANGNKVDKYDLNDSSQIMLSLRGLIEIEFAAFLSPNRANAKSVGILKDVLKKYLFYDIQSPEEFTETFLDYAHQGGFMHSMLCSHTMHILANPDAGFVLAGGESMATTRVDLTSHEREIEVVEKTELRGVSSLMDPEEPLTKDKLADMELRQRIFLAEDQKAHVQIVSAYETVYEANLRSPFTEQEISTPEILFGPELLAAARKRQQMLGDIMLYANKYIEKGHDKAMLKSLLEKYGEFGIDSVSTAKSVSKIRRILQPEQAAHHKGDKILAYLGQEVPDYANRVVANIKKHAALDQGKDYFEKNLKLLVRLGRADLAAELVLKPMEEEVEANPAYRKTYDKFLNSPDQSRGSFFRKAFEELTRIGYLSKTRSEITEDLKAYAEKFILEGHNEIEMARLFHKYPILTPAFYPRRETTEHRGDVIFAELGKLDSKYHLTIAGKIKNYAAIGDGEMPYVRALQLQSKLGQKDSVKKELQRQLDEVSAQGSQGSAEAKELRNDKNLLTEANLKRVYKVLSEYGFLPKQQVTPSPQPR